MGHSGVVWQWRYGDFELRLRGWISRTARIWDSETFCQVGCLLKAPVMQSKEGAKQCICTPSGERNRYRY